MQIVIVLIDTIRFLVICDVLTVIVYAYIALKSAKYETEVSQSQDVTSFSSKLMVNT